MKHLNLNVVVLFISAVTLLAACQPPATNTNQSTANSNATASNAKWDSYVEQFITDDFTSNPPLGVSQGRHEFDGKFPDWSEAGLTKELARLRSEREKAAAEEKFATERRALLQIAAPFAGTVMRVHVIPGQAVFPRDPIADLADLSTVQVRGDVAPELLRFLRPGMHVDVKVFSVPPRTFADEIDYVIPAQQTESRAAVVVVTIPNPDHSAQPNTEALITVRSLR